MSERPVKMKKYSKPTLALSDPPRCPKVDISETDSGGNLQVSTPIARRIERLYHKDSVSQSKKKPTDEKHPLVLRGISDNSALSSGRKYARKTRSYYSLDDASCLGPNRDKTSVDTSNSVHISMRNGEMLVFNESLDALEVQGTNYAENVSTDMKYRSLPIMKNKSTQRMLDGDKGTSSEDFIKKHFEREKSSQLNMETVEGSSDKSLCQTSKTDDNDSYHVESNSNLGSISDNAIEHDTSFPSVEDLVNSDSDNVESHFKDHPDENSVHSGTEEEDNRTLGKKSLYVTTGPALRKIDRYRESLKRRKKHNRSSSVPEYAQQLFYQPSAVSTPQSSGDKVKERKYFSKSADRPRSVSHLVIKSTPVSRSNSLGNLTFGNNFDNIPKGIAKQKISEIQKRVDEEEKRKREEQVRSPTSMTRITSPRFSSPTGANSPMYRTLSPPHAHVRSSMFFTTNTLGSRSTDMFGMSKSGPSSKQDAINILQTMIPSKSPANSPRSIDVQKLPSGKFDPDKANSGGRQNGDPDSEYPKPAPRRNSKLKKNRTENVKETYDLNIVHGSSSSVSSFSSTLSSGDDGHDKTMMSGSSVPVRPSRGVKRPSQMSEGSPVTVKSEKSERNTAKTPYVQVMPFRKRGPTMGISSFHRHSKGPAPPPPVSPEKKSPPLERQMEFEEAVGIVKETIRNNDDTFIFLPGNSQPSDTGDDDVSDITGNFSEETLQKLNLVGVTMDSSCDYEEIGKVQADGPAVTTGHSKANDSLEKCIIPAPHGFSDSLTETEGSEVYAVVDKAKKKIQEEESKPVPPPRLKKSTSLNFTKQDINGNEENYVRSKSHSLTDSHEESEDTYPAEGQNNNHTDYSSSEDILDDNYERYDPGYETLDNFVAKRRPHMLDVHNNNKPSSISDSVKTDNQSSVSQGETVRYPVSNIPVKETQITSTKTSKSKKKEKKKNKKRAQSFSPNRVMAETCKFSSDEDLLEERARRRTMSPTAVAKDLKDTVKKILRVRPGSPKDKVEKALSPHEPSGNGKKSVGAGRLITTGPSDIPGQEQGIKLLSIRKSSTEEKLFHIDFDSNSGQVPCHHCEEKNKGGGFDVNRYRGSQHKAPAKRASKSMGDIYEQMDKTSKEALEDVGQVHIDQVQGTRRKLPTTPRNRGTPILVKILGKDDAIDCQYSECASGHMQAVKICHHSDCQDLNDQHPLLLCHACDKQVHSESNNHLRFDVFKKAGNLQRNVSTRSLPGGLTQSDDEGGGRGADINGESDLKQNNSKLKRKKAMKNRYHTDECYPHQEMLHMRSASLQEGLHGHLQKSHSAGVILQTKETSQSEPSIERKASNDKQRQIGTGDGIGPKDQLSQDASEEGSDVYRHESEKVLFSQSAESLHNKSSESSQDIDYEDDEECSSILNYSPAHTTRSTKATEFKDINIGDNEPVYRGLPESRSQGKGFQQSQTSSTGKKDTPDAPVQKTPPPRTNQPKTPHRKTNKEDGSKKNMGMEFFTLKFDLLEDPNVYEIVAAVKGVSLKDAVCSSLERRNIDINQVDIFLASSNTALPLQVDCFPLGGNHLHVKARENENLSQFKRSTSTVSLNSTKYSRLSQPPKSSKPAVIYIRRDQQSRSSLPPPHALDPPVVHHRRTSLRPRSAIYGPYKTEPHPLVGGLHKGQVSRSGVDSEDEEEDSGKEDEQENEADSEDSEDGKAENIQKQETQKGKRSLGTVDDAGSVSSVSDVSFHSTNSLPSADSQRSKTLKPPTKLGMLFSPFAKSPEKHDFLLQQLENYSREGLPSMPSLLTFGKPQYDEATFTMEEHWSKLCGVNPEELSKKQRDQQMSIWELLCTELEHVRKLNVVIDLFYCCLMDLQNEGLLNEVKTEEVFSNIVDVCQCNQEFWANHLSKVVEHARKHKTLLDPSLLSDAFTKFDEIFKPYAKYCLEQRACVEYIRLKQSDNELFRTFIEWAEAQKQCNRLKLQDLVIIPMQRLTKYHLLLIAILARTEKEEHRKELKLMIEKVHKFVSQVNQVMHQREEHERLKMIIDRIEVYDIIDTPNIEEVQKLAGDFCKLDLTCPLPGCGPHERRHLLLEGGLKFRDANSRLDVYCFLFTDMLLITKANKKGDKVKVTKPPMRLDKCVVQLLRDGSSFMLVYLNEYHVATGVYTFHGDAAKIWVGHVRTAQDKYKRLRKEALESSNRMYWEMFYEENYEDDLAVLNPRHPSGESIEQTDGSLDTFLPNTDSGVARSNSHGAIRFDSTNQDSRKLRISSSLDENQVFKHNLRESVSRSDSEPSRIPLSLPRQSITDYSSSVNRSSTQPDVYFTSKSPGGVKSRPSASRTDSQSSGEGGQLVRPSHRPSKQQQQRRELPQKPTSASTEDYEHKGKLNQRRTRNEKRYHTADAIQDLRKDCKDSSIHKRLSWNLGSQAATDMSNQLDNKHHLNKKAFSSDSIRSMPSSSGVSSTGSLHLSPESEICEEYEEGEDVDEGHDSALMDNLSMPPGSEVGGYTLTLMQEASNHSDSSTNESSATLTAEHQLDGATSDESNGSSNGSSSHGDLVSNHASFSKSMPDISQISIREVREGVASAELSKSAKKMSHRELLNMKKQLLLNSTIEASEV